MIYNDGTSELQIRLHIAEMLKDKVEQDNYNELCEKALKFVMNGIELPKVKKNLVEEATEMLSKTFLLSNPLQDALKELGKGDLPKPKEDELKDIATKYKGKGVVYRGYCCRICGYSTEFDCLIAGTNEDCDDSINISERDVIVQSFNAYFYVGKDIVKND